VNIFLFAFANPIHSNSVQLKAQEEVEAEVGAE